MLRHHHDVSIGTSIRRTYLGRFCDVSLVRKYQFETNLKTTNLRRRNDVPTGT